MACTEMDYAYLRALVRRQTANTIDPSRNTLFDTKLAPVARMAGARSLKDFVDHLKKDRQAHLHRAVAEAMTINETSFFRDMKPFDMLREVVLPRLIEKRSGQRRLRIWSAASSTGQEAYSLAMMLAEHFPNTAGWDVKILGTDISRHVIEYAQRARYRRLEVNRGLPVRMLMNYLERDGEEWVVNERIQRMCEFERVNLCAPLPRMPQFDLVLLRNVLLYFTQQDRTHLFREVHRKMASDGCLLLGNAEQAEDSTNLFEVEFVNNSYCYRPVVNS